MNGLVGRAFEGGFHLGDVQSVGRNSIAPNGCCCWRNALPLFAPHVLTGLFALQDTPYMIEERFGRVNHLLAVELFFGLVIGFVPILNGVDRVVLQIRKLGHVFTAIAKNPYERTHVVRFRIGQPFAVIQAFKAFSIDCCA